MKNKISAHAFYALATTFVCLNFLNPIYKQGGGHGQIKGFLSFFFIIFAVISLVFILKEVSKNEVRKLVILLHIILISVIALVLSI